MADFEAFFNDLLNSIRKDWNLFTVQETLVKEVREFGDKVVDQLAKITGKDAQGQDQDISMLYEKLSHAQAQVSKEKEQWEEFENTLKALSQSVENHSEFEIIPGDEFKQFLAENVVMNYSNIELARAV